MLFPRNVSQDLGTIICLYVELCCRDFELISTKYKGKNKSDAFFLIYGFKFVKVKEKIKNGG